ncbi:MAG: hypothetical protein Q8942_12385 [Bacillota bacterium]|nr:hypothetical protein [Bacillota bacterium]
MVRLDERVDLFMVVLKVTPVRNVLIGKGCYKSERTDMFYNKVVNDGSKVEVFDVSDRRHKALLVSQLNKRNHRMLINNKRYFICSIVAV